MILYYVKSYLMMGPGAAIEGLADLESGGLAL